jgi:NAD(P)H-flavin reductase
MSENKKFNQIKYQNEYNKENYDRVYILFPKGMKEKIKERAKSQGKSLSSYVKDVVYNDLCKES